VKKHRAQGKTENIKLINMKHDPEKRIIELGLELPPAPKPAGVYKPVLVVDKFLYVSGQGPIRTDGTLMKGKLGADLDVRRSEQDKTPGEGFRNGKFCTYVRSAAFGNEWFQRAYG
jgi:hypothetical protein